MIFSTNTRNTSNAEDVRQYDLTMREEQEARRKETVALRGGRRSAGG